MIAMWMFLAVLMGLTLRWGIVLALKSEGTRAYVTWALIAFWFVLGQVMLIGFATEYPMAWIHTYVWMGPQYVFAINAIASVFATLFSTAVFTVTVRY